VRRVCVARRRLPARPKSVRLEAVDEILLHLDLVILLLLPLLLPISLPPEITVALVLELTLAVGVLALPTAVGTLPVQVLNAQLRFLEVRHIP